MSLAEVQRLRKQFQDACSEFLELNDNVNARIDLKDELITQIAWAVNLIVEET